MRPGLGSSLKSNRKHYQKKPQTSEVALERIKSSNSVPWGTHQHGWAEVRVISQMNYPVLAHYETPLYPFWKHVGIAEVRGGTWGHTSP